MPPFNVVWFTWFLPIPIVDRLAAHPVPVAFLLRIGHANPKDSVVMRLLGIPPGPQIGEAIAHLTAVRLQRGPMSVAEAEDAVTVWWLDRRRAAAS